MPLYPYRCATCGALTDLYWRNTHPPDTTACKACGGRDTHRVIGRAAYHMSDAAKTAKLDGKYEKMVDGAMRRTAGADPDRLIRRMQPLPRKGKTRKSD